MTDTIEIEYFDREMKYVGIGTFILCEINGIDTPIEKGDRFVVPSTEYARKKNFPNISSYSDRFTGCTEGRENSIGYKLPILLEVKGISDNHIISKGYGAYIKYLVYKEVES